MRRKVIDLTIEGDLESNNLESNDLEVIQNTKKRRKIIESTQKDTSLKSDDLEAILKTNRKINVHKEIASLYQMINRLGSGGELIILLRTGWRTIVTDNIQYGQQTDHIMGKCTACNYSRYLTTTITLEGKTYLLGRYCAQRIQIILPAIRALQTLLDRNDVVMRSRFWKYYYKFLDDDLVSLRNKPKSHLYIPSKKSVSFLDKLTRPSEGLKSADLEVKKKNIFSDYVLTKRKSRPSEGLKSADLEVKKNIFSDYVLTKQKPRPNEIIKNKKNSFSDYILTKRKSRPSEGLKSTDLEVKKNIFSDYVLTKRKSRPNEITKNKKNSFSDYILTKQKSRSIIPPKKENKFFASKKEILFSEVFGVK